MAAFDKSHFLKFPLIIAFMFVSLSVITKKGVGQEADPEQDQQDVVAEEVQELVPVSLFEKDDELETYVDGLVAGLKKKDNVPGIILSVVRDGKIILSKGYGIAHLDGETAVDASNTMFRIGSVSKAFTYIGIMQLVEQGKLSLDTPVNSLLPNDMQLPDEGYEAPILIWHLLTHTAGYEDSALGHLFTDQPEKAMRLGDYLKAHRPARVREAGTVSTYSNYSVSVAGYIIASISGKSFDAYVEDHILHPLGMNTSTFREPVPAADLKVGDDLKDKYSDGFNLSEGWWEDAGFEYISNMGPAGSASATPDDMARFMLALLNGGELEGNRILREETLNTMRETLFSNGPGYLPGLAHGFMTPRFGEFESFGHGGDTINFHTSMVTIPDLNIGVFASVNFSTAGMTPRLIVQQILEQLDPRLKPLPAPEPPANFATEGLKFAGNYLTTRRP